MNLSNRDEMEDRIIQVTNESQQQQEQQIILLQLISAKFFVFFLHILKRSLDNKFSNFTEVREDLKKKNVLIRLDLFLFYFF